MTSDSIDPAIEAARREHPQLDAPFAGVFSRLRRLVEIDEDALVRLYAGFSVRPPRWLSSTHFAVPGRRMS